MSDVEDYQFCKADLDEVGGRRGFIPTIKDLDPQLLINYGLRSEHPGSIWNRV